MIGAPRSATSAANRAGVGSSRSASKPRSADRRLLPRIPAEAHAPEAAAVGQDQLAAIGEGQVQLGEARRPAGRPLALPVRDELDAGRLRRLQSAGHAEVHAEPWAAVELEPEMLAVALDRHDTAAEERAADPAGGSANTMGSAAQTTATMRRPSATRAARRRAASTSGSSGTRGRLLHDLEQLDLEHQRRAGLDLGGAPRSP